MRSAHVLPSAPAPPSRPRCSSSSGSAGRHSSAATDSQKQKASCCRHKSGHYGDPLPKNPVRSLKQKCIVFFFSSLFLLSHNREAHPKKTPADDNKNNKSRAALRKSGCHVIKWAGPVWRREGGCTRAATAVLLKAWAISLFRLFSSSFLKNNFLGGREGNDQT